MRPRSDVKIQRFLPIITDLSILNATHTDDTVLQQKNDHKCKQGAFSKGNKDNRCISFSYAFWSSNKVTRVETWFQQPRKIKEIWPSWLDFHQGHCLSTRIYKRDKSWCAHVFYVRAWKAHWCPRETVKEWKSSYLMSQLWHTIHFILS